VPAEDDEDVHTALERGLIERAGADVGGRLRAGRSRNDQVATLFRMYLRDHARIVSPHLLLDVVDALSARRRPTSAPRCRAAPTSSTPSRCSSRTTCSPTRGRCCAMSIASATGTRGPPSRPTAPGALAGSSLGLDPGGRGRRPRFSPASVENSIDGTASRDFVAEFAFVCAMVGGRHLAARRGGRPLGDQGVRLRHPRRQLLDRVEHHAAEEEPDVAELARGKAGRLIGDLAGLLATLKALPLAYNRDLQEDKEPVFDAVDTLELLLPAVAGMVDDLVFDVERLESLAPQGFSARHRRRRVAGPQGVPFRVAHEVAGACVRGVRGARDRAVGPQRRRPAGISEHLTPGVREVLSVEGSLASRDAQGRHRPGAGRRAARAGPGSHAFRGWTPRTAPMFGIAGQTYVYFTYGMHHCANIVTGRTGTASAVLMRAGEVVAGHDLAAERRPGVRERDQARGPANLATTLGLTRAHDGLSLVGARAGGRVEPAGDTGRCRDDPYRPSRRCQRGGVATAARTRGGSGSTASPR
jgi:argininosuccinate lyase